MRRPSPAGAQTERRGGAAPVTALGAFAARVKAAVRADAEPLLSTVPNAARTGQENGRTATDDAAGPAGAPPAPTRLTLEEAKQRALASNKLLSAAALKVRAKGFAVRAMRANYFPTVTGTAVYMHFNDDLGEVLTTKDRSLLGKPLLTIPSKTFAVAVLQQDSSTFNLMALQPITDLLKVRQSVKLARADQQIAEAQLQAGIRKLLSGVEQLYRGLLAARRIQAGAREGLRGAELLAKTKTLEARTALVEARQALQQVDKQVADLQEQLDGLLDLPLCTPLDLVEPPLPLLPFHCADEVIGTALASSPEVREAQLTVGKADAAVAAGKLEYMPSVAVVGGYANQQMAPYVQPNIGYVGVLGTYTFVDWGRRRDVIHERQTLAAMAHLKLQQTQDEVRQKAVKAIRKITETREALQTAQELVGLRKEAEKAAMTPEALRNPTALIAATQARMLAEVDAIKAELAYRQAYVELMILVGDGCVAASACTGSSTPT
jgi:outer membrane protein TolC